MLQIIHPQDPQWQKIRQRSAANREDAAAIVRKIIQTVQEQGDQALLDYARQFDRVELSPDDLLISQAEIDQAYATVEPDFLQSIRQAKANIEKYHQQQKQNSWFAPETDGTILGQMIQPLQRVGVYVPGGKASYPSSVLMNVIPAKVAGVPEIVMVTPPSFSPYTLVTAVEAGVTEIYRVGGAQAIAALAYGTQSIARVDKITGPGNFFVMLAKQQVYGQVDIDMLAGPSEILIVADATAKPQAVAADLLSQAEHDEMAAAVLLTWDRDLAEKVQKAVEDELQALSRREIAAASLDNYGAIVLVQDLEEALALANAYAPEHLELLLAHPFEHLGKIKAAGAVFLGGYSPEPVGDYWAGPNHVLPTGGTARFYSPLGVDAFLKRTSVIAYSQAALNQAASGIIKLAETEGLTAHARAVQVRMED